MEFERRLQIALAPCRPSPALHLAILTQVAAASRVRKPLGRSRHLFMLGAVVALAAAAGMLVKGLFPSSAPVEVALAPEPSRRDVAAIPAHGPKVASDTTGQAPPPAASPGKSPAMRAPGPGHVAAETFAVQLLPLQDESTDPVGRAAVQTLHSAILQRLRAIPGLVLLETLPGEVAQGRAEYRITISAAGEAYPGNKFWVAVKTEFVTADGNAELQISTRLSGEMAPACSSAGRFDRVPLVSQIDCPDPVGIGIYAVDHLRRTAFPADASLQKQVREQLLDSALDSGHRFQAVDDLLALAARAQKGQRLVDPAVINGLVDLAAATDYQVRAKAWRKARGLRRQEFIPSLVATVRDDPHEEVRREAVATLATDFPTVADARNALAVVAREDTSALVRSVAQRGLADEAWKVTAIGVLKDGNRPAEERAEALMFYTSGVGPMVQPAPGDSGSVLQQLDDQAIEAIAAALVGHPSDDARARLALTRSRDTRMQAALEKMSVEDPDAARRQTAKIYLLSFSAQ